MFQRLDTERANVCLKLVIIEALDIFESVLNA